MSEEKNYSIELKQKMDNLGALIKLGFIPHDQKWYDNRWREFDKAQRQKRLRALSARR